jgi:dimethylargininase
MPIAFVRPVPDSFADCVTARPPDPPLDPVRARTQHDAYRTALAAGGFDVVEVPPAPGHPDSPFVEDTAVVVGDRALATRPGHPSRRGEVDAVAETLAAHLEVVRMDAPATLDGGDVLKVGDRVFVGLSSRTNAAGIEVLSDLCGGVMAIPVGRVLHLKSAVTAVDGETVLLHRPSLDAAAFEGLRVLDAPGGDPEAANVVRLPDGAILVAEHHAATADLLTGHGFGVVTVDVSEFARADGGLTCLSVRLRKDSGLARQAP